MKFKHALAIAFTALALMCIFGCSPAKIKAKALDEYKGSSKFPQDCADAFPIKIDTLYKEGRVVYDTTYAVTVETVTDTVVKQQETVYYRDRIINKVRVDTAIKVVENTAQIVALKREINELHNAYTVAIVKANNKIENQANVIKKRTKQRNIAGIILLSLLLAAGVWVYFKLKP